MVVVGGVYANQQKAPAAKRGSVTQSSAAATDSPGRIAMERALFCFACERVCMFIVKAWRVARGVDRGDDDDDAGDAYRQKHMTLYAWHRTLRVYDPFTAGEMLQML